LDNYFLSFVLFTIMVFILIIVIIVDFKSELW